MNVAIGWLGIIVGAVGSIFGYFRCRSAGGGGVPAARSTGAAAGWTLILAIVFWVISMMSRPPFSEGQTLGLGFLIGGISGALAILLSIRVGCVEASVYAERFSVHAISSFALFASSLTFVIFRSDPQWALIGFAIGAVMAAILLRYSSAQDSLAGVRVEAWALVSTTIAVGTVFAMQHFDQTVQRGMWGLPILVATTALIGSFVGMESERREGSYLVSALVSSAITLGLSIIYAWRLANDWSLLGAVGAGVAAFALGAWLSAARFNRNAGLNASIATFAVVAFTVLSFKLWSGLGIGLGLIAAWSIISPIFATGREEDKRWIKDLFSFGLSIFLFRFFVEAYRGELGNVDLRIHYAFVGAVIGALLPMILLSFLPVNAEGRGRISRVAALGFVTAATPLLLFLVWEIKAVLGFAFGAAVSSALLYFLRSEGECGNSSLCRYPGGLLIIGAELAAIQFVGPLDALSLTRLTRISVLSAAVVLLVVVLIVFSRYESRSQEVPDAR